MTLTEGFRDLRHERGEVPFKRYAPVRSPAEHKLHQDRNAKYVFGVHYEIHCGSGQNRKYVSESRFEGVGEAATEKTWRCQDCGAPREPQDGWCSRCGSTLPAEWR